MTKKNILMVASEVVPFAKTGGLADVAGSLPIYLKKSGHDVRIVLPKYSSIDSEKYDINFFHGPMGVNMGTNDEWCSIHRSFIEHDIPVYFIEHDIFFNREGLYHDNATNDYLDNPKRYAFLSKAALQLCIDIEFKPDIVHCNDWQTALCPAYLKTCFNEHPIFENTGSILTIHNIAYQGKYPAFDYEYMGLGWEHFHGDAFEDFNNINMLKGGIFFADIVNTVSPGYAEESRTQLGSHGISDFLNKKGQNYFGVLNGIDYTQWNPESDKLIPANYSASDMHGKKICKKALQQRLGLNVDENAPIVGVVSRFADQKGLSLLVGAAERLMESTNVQFAVLGSGDKSLEQYFASLSDRYPGKAGAYIGYSNELAHLIEAGADFFIMPSLYEPCGLNQIYSLKYGTVPIVRATGGLNDTIDQYEPNSAGGTGFKFDQISSDAVYDVVAKAVDTYNNKKDHFEKMQQTGMAKLFSWEKSTHEYEAAYEKAINNSMQS